MFSSNVKLAVVFILFFLFGLSGVFFYTKQETQKKAEVRKEIASKSAFSIENAPQNSVKGTITTLSGEVLWESRSATDSAPLTQEIKIQQGEILETGDTGLLTVNFPTLGELRLFQDTSVSVIQALTTSFVLSQLTGTTLYTSEVTTPISVRSLHLLATIKGKAEMTVDDEEGIITISVTDGVVTIAYNNTENISQVETISKGELVTFNDETRKTEIEVL